MTQPSARARQLLERYKAASALSADEKARLGGLLNERALRGDLPRFDVQPSAANAAPATPLEHFWSGGLAKIGLALVAAGAVGGGVYGLNKTAARQPSAPLAQVAPSAPARQLATSPAEPTAAQAEPEPTPTPRAPAVAPTRVKAERGEPAASTTEPTIDEEVKLMNAAQAALRAGDSKRALELLREHAARFPSGKLATLRQVTHMLALCQAGQSAQARQEASSFLAKNPDSPFSDRVNRICAPHD